MYGWRTIVFVYVFPSTQLLLYLLGNCIEGEQVIRDIQGCFLTYFLVQNCMSCTLKNTLNALFLKKKYPFMFARARQAFLFKFSQILTWPVYFCLISEVGGTRKFWSQNLVGKFVIQDLVLSMFQHARSKEGDFNIFWGTIWTL